MKNSQFLDELLEKRINCYNSVEQIDSDIIHAFGCKPAYCLLIFVILLHLFNIMV